MQIQDLRGKIAKVKDFPQRLPSEIETVAIHHSATLTGDGLAFARYNVTNRKWRGTSYWLVVRRSGLVQKCCNMTDVTPHVGSSNRSAIGICFEGNFDMQEPTASQWQAGVEAVASTIRSLEKARQVKPKGHREYPGYFWKSCPGRRFDMTRFNGDVNKALNSPAPMGGESVFYETVDLRLKLRAAFDRLVDRIFARFFAKDDSWYKLI